MVSNAMTETRQSGECCEERNDVRMYRPNVDIIENADEIRIAADVPGAKADGIDIEFEDGHLTINAKVGERHDRSAARFFHREYGVGDYHRCFNVNTEIDVDGITAGMSSGVLTVHLPKAKALRPRSIAVKPA